MRIHFFTAPFLLFFLLEMKDERACWRVVKKRSISWEMPSCEIELSINASLIPHELRKR